MRTIEAEPHEQGPAASQGNPLSQQDKDLIGQADANLFAGNMSSDLRNALRQRQQTDPKARRYDISELRPLNLRPGPPEPAHDLIADRLDPHFWMDPRHSC